MDFGPVSYRCSFESACGGHIRSLASFVYSVPYVIVLTEEAYGREPRPKKCRFCCTWVCTAQYRLEAFFYERLLRTMIVRMR